MLFLIGLAVGAVAAVWGWWEIKQKLEAIHNTAKATQAAVAAAPAVVAVPASK